VGELLRGVVGDIERTGTVLRCFAFQPSARLHPLVEQLLYAEGAIDRRTDAKELLAANGYVRFDYAGAVFALRGLVDDLEALRYYIARKETDALIRWRAAPVLFSRRATRRFEAASRVDPWLVQAGVSPQDASGMIMARLACGASLFDE
jgi:hypothetical protein